MSMPPRPTKADTAKPPAAKVAADRARRAAMAFRSKYTRELITPEGAALNLRIANAGERAGAFFIDFIIQMVTLALGLWAILSTIDAMGYEAANIGWSIAMIFIFVVRNFYFIAFEIGRRAATPGKRALGLRVASRGGGRLSADAVFARNFMREIEVFLPLQLLLMSAAGISSTVALLGLIWCLSFLLLPLFNRDKLRAGDIIAGTWVIHAPKAELLGDIASNTQIEAAGEFVFTPSQLDAYGIHELHVLENVLRSGSAEVKTNVTERIQKKIDWQPQPGESERRCLESYYAALRDHLERKMLFGKRKADKFDTA